jgi:hypothetical protein
MNKESSRYTTERSAMPDTFPLIERSRAKSIPVYLFAAKSYEAWSKKQSAATRNWLAANQYKPAPGKYCLLPAPLLSSSQLWIASAPYVSRL